MFQVKPLVMNYYPIFILSIIILISLSILKTKFYGTIEVKYPGNKSVFISKGTSILMLAKLVIYLTKRFVVEEVGVQHV